MAFVFYLCSLFLVGVWKEEDRAAVGLKVFSSYMNLCRKLQNTYRMEPAGSQGVWNLDDYQFVPFIWGAAQGWDSTLLIFFLIFGHGLTFKIILY